MLLTPNLFWLDKNGDGQRQEAEITNNVGGGSTFSIQIDDNGDIWYADRTGYIRLWRVTGEENGILQYGPQQIMPTPYITESQRVYYERDRDELFIAGYTQTHPRWDGSWGGLGTTILKYKNVTQKFASGVPLAEWEPDLELIIPKGDSGSSKDATAMDIAGDYIFCFLCRYGLVNIYHRETGEYIGQIAPGIEVGKQSGWTDFRHAINARYNESDGTYELLCEENGFAKVIHYMINSMESVPDIKGDLSPFRLHIQDENGITVDAATILAGQALTFAVDVKNIELGTVVNSRRNDPVRCQVQFKVIDSATDNTVYTALSTPWEEDIAGGQVIRLQVDRSSFQPFILGEGHFQLEVNVNYQNKGQECYADNNIVRAAFEDIEYVYTSLAPAPVSARMSVWPNPAAVQLCIETDNEYTGSRFKLLRIEGTGILSGATTGSVTRIDVSHLPEGIYLLQVENNAWKYRQKIIIKK
jgi:hypothetical protein